MRGGPTIATLSLLHAVNTRSRSTQQPQKPQLGLARAAYLRYEVRYVIEAPVRAQRGRRGKTQCVCPTQL